MQAKYVAAVKYLTITGDLGRDDRITDSIFITNNRILIRDLIPREYIPVMGSLEWQFIQDSPSVIWGTANFEHETDALPILNAKLYEIQGFLTSLWLFFDNSVDTEIGFLFYSNKGLPMVTSSYIDVARYTAQGASIAASLNRERLQEIRTFHRETFHYEPFASHPVTKVVRGEGRITRALYLVQVARSSKDLGLKIMHYCTALETLFATSQVELAHQLSERVACFTETTGSERIQAYRTMKKAYGFRSKISHGAAIADKDFSELVSVSVSCDNFLRSSFRRIFADQKIAQLFGSDTQLDDFFIGLILGDRET
jgi:hypothetical protein